MQFMDATKNERDNYPRAIVKSDIGVPDGMKAELPRSDRCPRDRQPGGEKVRHLGA